MTARRPTTFASLRPFTTSIRHGRINLDVIQLCEMREQHRDRIAASNDRLLHTMSAKALGKVA